ncbi:MAG: hypothetical protein JSW00_16770 [Thermoplasmata archaeon]|nr:MAG: hypothetical protein JSW00_16770 [Thermoplasmata archaeon]
MFFLKQWAKLFNNRLFIDIIGEKMSTKELEELKAFIQERKLSGDYCAQAH